MKTDSQFNPQDWDIYTNKGGFCLFIPKKYAAQNPLIGFKTEVLEKFTYPEDIASTYFDIHNQTSVVNALADFFLTYADMSEGKMPYAWDIILAGHGGSQYKESNENEVLSWVGKPIIADLDANEFKAVLDFFQFKVKTHLFHYSSCYAGGNHLSLIFNNTSKQTYDFAVTCDTLTDCTSYCKWTNSLPSEQKKFLKTTDLAYDSAKQCWYMPLSPVYHWKDFFNGLTTVDFSLASIEKLQQVMAYIVHPIISNISLICLPGTREFFPLQSSDMIKIDERLVNSVEKSEPIEINGINTLLVERGCIEPTIILDAVDPLRIISIKPDDAVHYIKKLKSVHYLDLPCVFWQAPFQNYDKTFVIEECEFPYSRNSEIFKEPVEGSKIVLKNVIISQQKNHCIRLFFTFNHVAMMVVAHKPGQAEHKDQTSIQEVITLTAQAKEKYIKYYLDFANFLIDCTERSKIQRSKF